MSSFFARLSFFKHAHRWDTEKRAYIRKVELYGLNASKMESIRGSTAEVEFKLRNTGNRTLGTVDVTVYFLDAKGLAIYEKDFRPVFVSDLFNDGKPLRPNYIWQLESDRLYTADAPDEWKVGEVSAKVTDIEFMDD